MNETTRIQTLEAVRGIYEQRLRLIRRAQNAARLAHDEVGYISQLEAAIENLRLAEIQLRIDYENQVKFWEEQKE